ncbi:TesB-like acyl-CoA thioesterase 5 [Carbonactinospora thermoautotrophica]|uniref:TesB-like acyl-CoA thioesterase 5 n=1 Tax=Carbonactinospora thermoautotrophica TaxID=1469144 RepID=A0A132N3X0_9ACTN|nr:thioesterase family protein [Carbonactinospora thermoautotrophica]KWX04835.1 TesB-like acyl-CoA thioesterase 5 [Carbonactinospora thermoautotrophica]KWX10046.1 TesB-like acyl-CoA thioesterase 5 [Carbonactinospora thermoautotrophica]
MGGAFYEPLGESRYRSTEHTAGPWSATSQHLGPPSALVVRELERCAPRDHMRLARVTVEVLGPVPVADLQVRAHLERPGRSVELLSAELSAQGRVAIRARAWRIARTDTAAVADTARTRLQPPEQAQPMPIPDGWGRGYLDAMEWRALRGGFTELGTATVWARPLVDLVDGEPTTDLERLFLVADSASGVSSRLDIRRWLFINTDLTVHLHRYPVGEWTALDAATAIGPDGAGVATSVLHDLQGPVGRTAQALLVRPRDAAAS